MCWGRVGAGVEFHADVAIGSGVGNIGDVGCTVINAVVVMVLVSRMHRFVAAVIFLEHFLYACVSLLAWSGLACMRSSFYSWWPIFFPSNRDFGETRCSSQLYGCGVLLLMVTAFCCSGPGPDKKLTWIRSSSLSRLLLLLCDHRSQALLLVCKGGA